jgi:protein TonB
MMVVGLTLESTSSTGNGPAFAVGNTVAGSTERTAAAPQAYEPRVPVAPREPPSRNRRAAPHVAEGVNVQAARRLSRVEPEYPPLLRQQGIEGDVTVRVYLTIAGAVERVELVRSAGDPAFDQAALAAAKRERFSPETHDGAPVNTALTYSYRFRITP